MKNGILVSVLFVITFFSNAQTYSWSGLSAIRDFRTDTVPLSINGMTNVIDSNNGLAYICLDITNT